MVDFTTAQIAGPSGSRVSVRQPAVDRTAETVGNTIASAITAFGVSQGREDRE